MTELIEIPEEDTELFWNMWLKMPFFFLNVTAQRHIIY